MQSTRFLDLSTKEYRDLVLQRSDISRPSYCHKDTMPLHWECCPSLDEIPSGLRYNGTFVDLTGEIIGNFTVVGFKNFKRLNRYPWKWIVHCNICGHYEAKTTRALRKKTDIMCCFCKAEKNNTVHKEWMNYFIMNEDYTQGFN